MASRERQWKTTIGKVKFLPHHIELDTPIRRAKATHGDLVMTLMTTHSHDPYNTNTYALDDRYRGVFGHHHGPDWPQELDHVAPLCTTDGAKENAVTAIA